MGSPRYATCPDELTALLAEKIAALGGREVRTGYRVEGAPGPAQRDAGRGAAGDLWL